MPITYTARQEPDLSWSVVVEETGTFVRLAGRPQTGLEMEDAEALAERLRSMAASLPDSTRH